MHAVPLASSQFISSLRSYQLEVQDPTKMHKFKRMLEKSDSEELKINLECRKSKIPSKPL